MLKPGGYAVTDDWLTGKVECDTFTCRHCQQVVFVKPMQRPEDVGGMCFVCMGLVCPGCADKRTCTPVEKQLELAERRADTLRSYGMG